LEKKKKKKNSWDKQWFSICWSFPCDENLLILWKIWGNFAPKNQGIRNKNNLLILCICVKFGMKKNSLQTSIPILTNGISHMTHNGILILIIF
jgi:hypothetical protein